VHSAVASVRKPDWHACAPTQSSTAAGTVQDTTANASFEQLPTDNRDGKQYLMALRDRFLAQ
jgi:hypothetical protein